MSKLRLLGVAVVACLAVGSVAAVSMAGARGHHHHHHHKPKTVQVKTKANFTYNKGQAPGTYTPYAPYSPYDPYGQNASFAGKVKAEKGCARRRSITVSQLGHTSSAKDGQFGFTVPGSSAPAGNYRVHVKGKTMERGHGKHKRTIRCKPASKTLTLTAARARPHKAAHVPSKVKIAYQAPGNEYSPDTGFTGTVKAKQGCAAKRTVKLSHYGKTKTSKSGAYAFGVGASGADPGSYKVKVASKTIDGGDTVCDAVKASITVNG